MTNLQYSDSYTENLGGLGDFDTIVDDSLTHDQNSGGGGLTSGGTTQVKEPIQEPKKKDGCTDCGSKKPSGTVSTIAPVQDFPKFTGDLYPELQDVQAQHKMGSYLPLIILALIAYLFNKD